MALRKEDLPERDAAIYRFPSAARRRLRRRYLRRRLTVAAAAVAVVGLFLLGGAHSPGSRPGAPRAIVVRSGETLWAIAGRYAPEDTDPRAYVDAMVRLNGIRGTPQAGMRLRLPR